MFGLMNRKDFDFDSVIDRFVNDRWNQITRERVTGVFPVVDIFEDENSVVMKLDLPGIRKEDIEINIEESLLTIRGEKKAGAEEGEKRTYHMRERAFGKFSRAFTIGDTIDADSVKAEFNDGVLTLTMSRVVPPKPEKKVITIS